jgi:hypothetical protein
VTFTFSGFPAYEWVVLLRFLVLDSFVRKLFICMSRYCLPSCNVIQLSFFFFLFLLSHGESSSMSLEVSFFGSLWSHCSWTGDWCDESGGWILKPIFKISRLNCSTPKKCFYLNFFC